MAIATIIYRKPPSSIAEIELDANLGEAHNFTSQVPQFPIEIGSPVTDHIINQPVDLTLEGFITNSPVKILGGRLGTIIGRTTDNRVATAFTALTDVRESKEPFTVVTGLKVYRNMVFKALNIPKNVMTGDALRFTARLTRIRKVRAKTIELENLREAEKNTTAPEVKREKQTTSPATAEETEKATSLYLRLKRWVFGG